MTAQEITLLLYNLTLVPVIFFSILFLLFAFLNIFTRSQKNFSVFKGKKPFVTIQIPVYNDDIAKECVAYCKKMDYPKDKYEILIIDDSTDIKIAQGLKKLSDGSFIKYIHRNNRDGFKPGALKNAMKMTKGEIIIIFDSDWKPEPDFINKVITPIVENPDVAIVQAKQTFTNSEKNLVTRFASHLLMIYHSVIMPINNRVNTVFFCGTAGAIRRDVLDEVGGWNAHSITEDADLSVKILSKGYRNVYLSLPVKSEVPETIEGFIKQQMRWCYGMTRTFLDNWKLIFSRKIKMKQKVMISYITLANIISPVVILMTLFGMSGWFIGEPELFKVQDLVNFILKFLYTSGYLLLGFITFYRERKLKEMPYFFLGTISVSFVLIIFNSIAFIKAVFNKPLFWYRTPKTGAHAADV